MKKLDVEHFLNIYTLRMKMQESGVTNPPEAGKKFTRELVEKLSKLPMDEEIKIIDRTFVNSHGEVILKIPDGLENKS